MNIDYMKGIRDQLIKKVGTLKALWLYVNTMHLTLDEQYAILERFINERTPQ